jgi:hypothetical protein
MNYRNAKYIDGTRIDCEIEHSVHGWIPYTLDPTDTDMTVNNNDLLAAMTAAGNVAALVPPTQAELDAAAAEDVRASKAAVKAEAGRRIEAAFPAWEQRNMNAAATALIMTHVTVGSWTAEEQAQADALTAAWALVSSIRSASDVLEAMNPIPLDYSEDKHWV